MTDDETELADLLCSACGRITEHDVVYAGRLLLHTECHRCHHIVRYPHESLPEEYLEDLKDRVRTKPRRLLRRANRHPRSFLAGLPGAVLRQPRKLIGEFRRVRRENAQDRRRQGRGGT